MAFPSESPLNRFPVLRYDAGRFEGFDEASAPSEDPSDLPAGSADMEVNGLGSVPNLSFYQSMRTASPAAKPADLPPENSALAPKDSIEISAAGQAFDVSSAAPSLRAERLAQIKAAIEDGSYDTPERLEAALDRMFSRLGLLDD